MIGPDNILLILVVVLVLDKLYTHYVYNKISDKIEENHSNKKKMVRRMYSDFLKKRAKNTNIYDMHDDGSYSGNEFRINKLEPSFENSADDSTFTIFLDDEKGYSASFLSQVFGTLGRRYGAKRVLDKLIFVSSDNLQIKEIKEHIIGGSRWWELEPKQ